MRAAIAILVLALFAGGIGAPSVCAALCAGASASTPMAQASAHHGHHAGHAVPDTTAVSATPCIDYKASAQVAMVPRPQESAAFVAVTLGQERPRTISARRIAVAFLTSPPLAGPLPDPPLRI